jgi:REP-associated tyrosine transposase
MSHTYSNLLSHLIFSTKERARLIDPELKPRLFEYMNGIVVENGGQVLSLDGVADHVHMLWKLPPSLAVADMARVLKTNSSKWVHDTWNSRSGFAWQTGYAAFSVSQSNVPAVARYIERQETHHRRTTFQEEFTEFLVRHGIQYDPRYMWG